MTDSVGSATGSATVANLKLTANLGASGVTWLQQELRGRLASAPAVLILDGSHVEQLGTGSLQLILAAARSLETAGGRLEIIGASAAMTSWAALAGFADLLPDAPRPETKN